jgi:4a-hydroxytetrahydrobiopterin dehydratase
MVSTSIHWEEKDNQLIKTFVFKNFTEAINFIQLASFKIEKINHHPEWTNIYNKVIVKICTHSAGNTITSKDRELAITLDKLAKNCI